MRLPWAPVAVVVCAAALQACSSPPPPDAGAARTTAPPPEAAAFRLTATLATPHDVDLQWQDPNPGAAGHIVEFATEPKGEYTILAFLPREATSFRHPDLIPDTTFYYRARAYYGPLSNEVEIALSASLSDKAYEARYGKDEDYQWAVPKTEPQPAPMSGRSIRSASPEGGAPGDLRAALVPSTVSGFQLAWHDRSSDEEGFFLEMRREGAPGFEIVAVTEPNINRFGYGLKPPERKASFRVRAYYYGPSSNVEMKRTGPETPSSSPAGK
jgi:hypothetical protein